MTFDLDPGSVPCPSVTVAMCYSALEPLMSCLRQPLPKCSGIDSTSHSYALQSLPESHRAVKMPVTLKLSFICGEPFPQGDGAMPVCAVLRFRSDP